MTAPTLDHRLAPLVAVTAAVLVLAVLLADGGVAMEICLLVVAVAPLVTMIGYETVGHRHQRSVLERQGA